MTDDAELLSAWRGGDRSAAETLVERHYDSVLRFFRTKAGDAAEDLVQRTFLRCVEPTIAFRGDSTFKAFLFGILQVLCVAGVMVALDRPARITSAVTAGAVIAVLILTRGYRVKPMESVRWSLRRALRRLPVDLSIGLFIGGIVGMVDNLAANAAMGVLGASSLTVVSALEPAERQARVRPNEGVLRSLRYGLWFSLFLPLPVSLIFAYGIWPNLATDKVGTFGTSTLAPGVQLTLTLQAFGVSVLFLAQGGAAAIFHYVMRLLLALRTPLPLNLVRFLDDCVERGLMRRIGGGYIFLHRTLLEHLADADGTDGAEGRRAGAPMKAT